MTPLILLTNDDGIRSPGLLASAIACAPLGELLIVAPLHQQSALGRSKPPTSSGRIERFDVPVDGQLLTVYGIEGSPAQMVEYAVLELAKRPVALCVSGINYGENIGEGVTVSGTVGAALEAAAFGIPALAVSRQTDPVHYYTHDESVNFQVAGHFVHRFAQRVLQQGLPQGVELLKIDLPEEAQIDTPVRWTRISQQRYFYPVVRPRRVLEEPSPLDFERRADPARLEPDSDVWAVILDKVVSVTPMVRDLTARVKQDQLAMWG